MSGVIISWGGYIQRSISLSKELEYKDLHIAPLFVSKKLLLLNYIRAFWLTFLFLKKNKDLEVVIVVAPPVFTIYSALFSRFMLRRKFKIISDLHNGVLRREWANWPFITKVLLGCDLVLSHNKFVKENIDNRFCINSMVLTDPLLTLNDSVCTNSVSQYLDENKENVLVPLSYAKDEPVDEIVATAEKLRDTHNFILTGNYLKYFTVMSASDLPVVFTGYIESAVYESLLKNVDTVLCLTKDPLIQMCALIEAISYKKNVICSNNPVNHYYFEKYGCGYVDLNSTSMKLVLSHGEYKFGMDRRDLFVKDYTKNWRCKVELFR